jgi:polar amino acid transport system permease protein
MIRVAVSTAAPRRGPKGRRFRGARGEEATTYVFNLQVVYDHWPELMHGAWMTLLLSIKVTFVGLLLGLIGAPLQLYGGRLARGVITVWIELFRNTPLLVQLFLVYFGLPQLGIRLDANTAAMIGMSIYLGAFTTEIIRAGIESIPRGQIESAQALGLKPLHIFRFVVLVPAIRAILPALGSQFVIVMLGSSVVSSISAEELASTANSLQTLTFRPFEIYAAASLIYLTMALFLRGLIALLARGYVGRWQE